MQTYFTVVLRNDDIQEFDSKCDGILLSMTQIPPDDILESLYKLRIRESAKLKTVLELYDLEIHQKKLGPDYHRLKTTGCFFGIGALVFEKVLISETRGPILRNRGPIRRNNVSLNRTAHSSAVLFSETLFRWIGPRNFYRKNKCFF